ncbi:MAG: hypothetical protein PVH88_01070 [Ignavibacteria bacterium]|jgi:hypothetical protein
MAQITLINNTSENIRIAVFKKPYKAPSLKVVAWRIEALPNNGGNTSVPIPSNYEVYINYSLNPATRDDPYAGIKTAPINIDVQTAKFLVREEPTNDKNASVATLNRVFVDVVGNEIQIENQASFGVWGHIMLDGQDVYPPQVITPGRTLMEDIRSPIYIAVIDEFIIRGNVVKIEELSSLPVEVLTGDVVSVTGDKWQGYSLTKK